jgi:hypothetical protein
MRIFGDTRCEAMRRKGSAAASAPRKNLILPQANSRGARCLQFAARLVGRVNVRGMREPQLARKCFPRRRISYRTTRRRSCASRSSAPQAIEQASESPRLHTRLLTPRYSSTSIDTVFRIKRRAAKPQNAADCHQFAATRLKFAARPGLFARHPATRLKRFNQRRFWSRSDRGVLILPQVAQLHLT